MNALLNANEADRDKCLEIYRETDEKEKEAYFLERAALMDREKDE